MSVQIISKLLSGIYSKIKRSLELQKYDDFSIEEYFRKQGAQVGSNNRILVRDLGREPYLINIGNHCTITNDVAFIVHDGGGWIFTDEIPTLQKFGTIEILDNCFIGFKATIMPDITIGPNSIVGACSVVTENVPPNMVVAGNPAKKICSIDEYKEKILQNWEKQKPPGYLNDLMEGVKYPPKYIEKMKRRDSHLLRKHLTKLFWSENS